MFVVRIFFVCYLSVAVFLFQRIFTMHPKKNCQSLMGNVFCLLLYRLSVISGRKKEEFVMLATVFLVTLPSFIHSLVRSFILILLLMWCIIIVMIISYCAQSFISDILSKSSMYFMIKVVTKISFSLFLLSFSLLPWMSLGPNSCQIIFHPVGSLYYRKCVCCVFVRSKITHGFIQERNTVFVYNFFGNHHWEISRKISLI